jgi:hypothetical protein
MLDMGGNWVVAPLRESLMAASVNRIIRDGIPLPKWPWALFYLIGDRWPYAGLGFYTFNRVKQCRTFFELDIFIYPSNSEAGCPSLLLKAGRYITSGTAVLCTHHVNGRSPACPCASHRRILKYCITISIPTKLLYFKSIRTSSRGNPRVVMNKRIFRAGGQSEDCFRLILEWHWTLIAHPGITSLELEVSKPIKWWFVSDATMMIEVQLLPLIRWIPENNRLRVQRLSSCLEYTRSYMFRKVAK